MLDTKNLCYSTHIIAQTQTKQRNDQKISKQHPL